MARSSKGSAKPKCLTCDNDAGYCGLCDACRQAAYRMMRSGKATRKELEEKKLILPARRGRRKSRWTVEAERALEAGA